MEHVILLLVAIAAFKQIEYGTYTYGTYTYGT